MNSQLRQRAYHEAAALLESDMDAVDLPEDLTESQESDMREFIRNTIAEELRAKGNAQ